MPEVDPLMLVSVLLYHPQARYTHELFPCVNAAISDFVCDSLQASSYSLVLCPLFALESKLV